MAPIASLLALGLLARQSTSSTGPVAVPLGAAGGFAVLAKSGIASVPKSSVVGDIGVSPAALTYVTGFSVDYVSGSPYATSTQVTGNVYAADLGNPTPAYLTASVSDMQAAYSNATGRVNPDYYNVLDGAIGGSTFGPGLYNWDGGLSFNSSITISGGSAAENATFIFQVGGGFQMGPSISIILTDGAVAENIVWAVADSVQIGAGSVFEGTLLAATSVTAKTGSTVNGRILAQTNVALQMATVTPPTSSS